MSYPKMMRIKQHFEVTILPDVAEAVRQEVAKLNLQGRIKTGDSVAITVGSRGVANIALIVKTLVEELKALGAAPFIVPAMGSHGGGTAEGQRGIVEGYGVTESYVGAPIRSSMEVVQVGATEDGVPVFFDKYAYEADHVAVVARVRPHTDFNGEIESGLHKMMLIGLGKHHGAKIYHQAIVHYTFDHIVRSVGRTVIEKCKVLLGLATVENVHHDTGLVRAVAPEEFVEREKELLVIARQWMPRVPFMKADLLIVDEIGKNISGSGMDSNVIGRKFGMHSAGAEEYPKVTRVYIRDLTDETKGNATGIGYAEYAHSRLVKKIDQEITNINCLTGNSPALASIPVHFDTDKVALDNMLQTIGYVQPEDARVIRIRNTLDLGEVFVSQAYEPELAGREDLTPVESPSEIKFNAEGDLLPF